MAKFRCSECNSPMDPAAEDGRLLSPMRCDRCAGRIVPTPTSRSDVQSRRIRFPLIALFAITTLLCLFLETIRWFGMIGVSVFAELLVLVIGLANLGRRRSVFGIPIPKVTVVEFITLSLNCGLLYLLALPPANPGGHRRGLRPVMAPAALPAVGNSPSTSPNDGPRGK